MAVGVRIVDDPSPSGDGLPPMDVPVFIGFAARGPRDRPVVVESPEGFEAVFGGLLDLVQAGQGVDPAERLVAHLQPAVVAFFAGGGRRCFVIRVTGAGASHARFNVPGLRFARRGASGWSLVAGEIALRADSPGAWTDRMSLSARLRSVAVHADEPARRGELLRARLPSALAQPGWLAVRAEQTLAAALLSDAWFWPAGKPAGSGPLNTANWLIERVSVDLALRESGQPTQGLQDCALVPSPAELPWWAPTADEVYDAGLPPSAWPLCGASTGLPAGEWMLVPQGMAEDFDVWRERSPDPTDALTRNGLDRFETGYFLDPDWRAELRGPALLAWADDLRFLSARSRRLRGLHGALGRDDACAREASWIVLTDALHPGWQREAPLPVRELQVHAVPDPVCTCPPLDFDNCAPPPPKPPQVPRFAVLPAVDHAPVMLPADTPLTLRLLSALSPEPTELEVQRAGQPDFSDAQPLFTAHPNAAAPFRLPAGPWWLRARAHRAGLRSGWSEPLALDVRATGWRALPQTDPAIATALHQALIQLCAATREHFALLAAPPDWRAPTLAAHIAELRRDAALADRETAAASASFAALFHPWLLQRDSDDRLRPHPPLGALAGLMARRSRLKGAWSAPGAEGLAQGLARRGELLGAADIEACGANPLELRDGGVAATRAYTLSTEPDWQSLGVRRLFILLRRLARREGERFVFEPNDLTLRRGLERSFDAWLHRLMQRGAFRGVGAASSYLIKTASGVEAAREIERGECSLLIQVAPSRPLRFLTLHLRRSGEQLLIEER